ncbi:response regulator receiver protein [Microbacterium sp. CFH 90308]|uniref:Response regulator receiver protein n=1 Tax=Microbacterium salsuginis TaxID=2722803 RepID=A0ABX1KAD1_9MICO|nr:NDP-hexose 2,3-dehydratase family protein [Microbacterium sp. CFH 90308]NLP83914.1 response regulator receiver protein [Microbacterium sp. CFH 90308]
MTLRDELFAVAARLENAADRDQIREYIDLVLSDENAFYNTDELREWIDAIRAASPIQLDRKNISDLRNWHVDPITGEIFHASGEFFRVIGVGITNSAREVSGWDQPFIYQKEAGILGIIRTRFDGVWHYLLNAKAEPGNTLLYQISPTLQATYSNLKTAHGGRVPRFSEFFVEEGAAPRKVVYRQWLAEDGGRFFLKSNLNMLVEVAAEDLPVLPDEYRWFTLSQIKQLLREDNYINPHVRGILCHL